MMGGASRAKEQMFLWQIGFLYLGRSLKGQANKTVLWQIGFLCILVGAPNGQANKWFYDKIGFLYLSGRETTFGHSMGPHTYLILQAKQ